MLAVIEGNATIGKVLVSRGAKIDHTNKFGDCALSLAAHKGMDPLLLASRAGSKQAVSHGWDLSEWIKEMSGLPSEKITLLLELCVSTDCHVQLIGKGL